MCGCGWGLEVVVVGCGGDIFCNSGGDLGLGLYMVVGFIIEIFFVGWGGLGVVWLGG